MSLRGFKKQKWFLWTIALLFFIFLYFLAISLPSSNSGNNICIVAKKNWLARNNQKHQNILQSFVIAPTRAYSISCTPGSRKMKCNTIHRKEITWLLLSLSGIDLRNSLNLFHTCTNFSQIKV